MQELTKTQIRKIRGQLMLKGLTTRAIMEKFDVSVSAVNQAITGDCQSGRLQNFIAEQIGYWPYPWEQGTTTRSRAE